MTEELPKQPPKKPKVTITLSTRVMPANIAASLRELAAFSRAEQQAKPEGEENQP